MFRRCTVLLLACAPLAVVAAPVPPPSEKEQIAKLWGKTEGEGEFELKGKRLTIRTAGKPTRGVINLRRHEVDMPRTVRTVKGDFEATVTVVDAALPATKSEDGGTTRAGIVVLGGDHGVEVCFSQSFRPVNGVPEKALRRDVWVYLGCPLAYMGSSLESVKAGQSPRLRIVRKGKVVTVSSSFDGKEWSKPARPGENSIKPKIGPELGFPDEVTVGVFFAQSTHQNASATFEDFRIETSAKPK
jgi:hypothetical protein